jgi:hypothetical protein
MVDYSILQRAPTDPHLMACITEIKYLAQDHGSRWLMAAYKLEPADIQAALYGIILPMVMEGIGGQPR